MSEEKVYVIMSGDIPTARWENHELTVLDEKHLPLYLKRVRNADMWLETRAIDSHRANSRLLKKALRLRERDDLATVMNVNAATITDNYWVRPQDSSLTYRDIRFGDDYFSMLALTGSYDSFDQVAKNTSGRTPELTNTGSFEKCWRLIGGKWQMYKVANDNEMFSEIFICRLGTALGMNMAVYEQGEGYVKTYDFTDSAAVNFEPAFSFMGDNEDYGDTVRKLRELCPPAVSDYVKMIFLDTIVANPDRHTANFGLLRDTDSGDLIGFAPIFDHNMALIARGYPQKPQKSDFLISLFNELLKEYPEYKMHLPQVKEDILHRIMNEMNMNVRTQEIADLIMSRYRLINI